jgi:transcriptional regulator with XRE-family HTH domain
MPAKRKAKPKAKMGRPEKQPDFNKMVTGLCLMGYTDAQLAEYIGISTRTLTRWKKSKPDFCLAIKEGRDAADAKVCASLYERACGYSHPEEKIFTYLGTVIRVETTKHYPPETAAIAFWLKNRHPELWKDYKHVELPVSFDADEKEAARMVKKRTVTEWMKEYSDYEAE